MMNEFETCSSKLLNERYYKFIHKSGLKIYVYPKNMSVTYGILSVNFGGNVTEYFKNENKTELPCGCAHFLEHKLFDNPNRTNADDVFSSFGAYSNAYTSNDRTAYLFSTTDRETDCLEQLMYFVTHPYFTSATVNKEMGIIAEEIRGCTDDPYDRCYLGMLDGMYFENPVKNEICGSKASISEITPELLYKCCHDIYVPSNMILSVCGKTEPSTVLSVVNRALNVCEEQLPKYPTFKEPEWVKRAYTERKMSVGKPLFCIGVKDVHIPSDPYERYRRSETVSILLHTLFSEAGDFYLRMLNEGLLSPGFDFGYSSNASTAYTAFSGESENPEALLQRIKEFIRESIDGGICEIDFRREQKCAYASYVAEFDSTEDIAFSINAYAADDIDIFEYPRIISDIDINYASKLLDEIFKDEYFTLSVIRP